MKWLWLFFGTGCSSWELVQTEKNLTSCWFSDDNPTPVDGGLNWNIQASDMGVGYDFPYDGIDQNCDGADDFDRDGDGFRPAFFAGASDVDCWDSSFSPLEGISGSDIHSNGDETVYDGIDQNCDGRSDIDVDGDGFGSQEHVGLVLYQWSPDFSAEAILALKESMQDLDDEAKQEAINQYFDRIQEEENWEAGDCWDNPEEERSPLNDFSPLTPAEVYPGVEDRAYDGIDQDCAGQDTEFDVDGDGYLSNQYAQVDGSIGDDCNDSNPEQYPNPDIEEIYYNGIDENCDASTADGDADGDGFWEIEYFQLVGLDAEDIDASVHLPEEEKISDCNDQNSLIFPGSAERCNGIDDGCAGSLSEDEVDADQDGFVSCLIEGTGWQGEITTGFDTMNGLDCDDGDQTVFPLAPELCDGLDNNCDGSVALVENDDDGDLYVECDIDIDGWDIENTIAGGLDCDDGDPTIFPLAPELCDGLDNDCNTQMPVEEQDVDNDGFVVCSIETGGWKGTNTAMLGDDCDDGNAIINPNTLWYEDYDLDLFGGEASQQSCLQPLGHVLDAGDCNDAEAEIFPGAIEIPVDGIDQDCNLFEDCYIDVDGDGFGSNTITSSALEDYACVVGSVSNTHDDCDDTEEQAYPGAAILEPDVDGDGVIDCTIDIDGDGFGDLYAGGSTMPGSDCDDGDDSVFVGAIEKCDGLDNDCDAILPDEEIDADSDGYVVCVLDIEGWDGSTTNGFTAMLGDVCDDGNALINPSTQWYEDADADGFGASSVSIQSCESPAGYVDNDDDCDDGTPLIGDTRLWYEDIDEDGIGEATSISTQCERPTGFSHMNGDCDPSDAGDAQICLDVWEGINIVGAAKGIEHNNDRDRFANVLTQGEINGTEYFVFGAAYRKYQNNNLRGGVFLFDDLLSVSDTTEATLTINGTSSVNALGTGLLIEDVTQDGINDLVVSATNSPPALYVFSGDTLAGLGPLIDEDDATHSVTSDGLGNRMGQRVYFSDVTQDGVSDLIVDVYKSDQVAVIPNGITSNVVLEDNTTSSDYFFVEGEGGSSEFGLSMEVTDVDHDNVSDLIVSDPRYNNKRGRVYIQNDVMATIGQDITAGSPILIDTGYTSHQAWLGSFVRVLDINGDGNQEVIVTEKRRNTEHKIYVFDLEALRVDRGGVDIADYINNTPSLLTADSGDNIVDASYVISSMDNNEFTVLSMDTIDGYLAVGASFFDNNQGGVALFAYEDRLSLPSSDREVQFRPEDAHLFIRNEVSGSGDIRLGSLVRNVGDITGDGHDDLLIGAQGADGTEGIIRLLPGPF